MMYPEFRAGDIFLTQGDSFISKAIRFFTRDKGEEKTEVNHVGIVVGTGGKFSSPIVEALSTVKRRKMSSYANSKSTKVAVYRKADLDPHQEATIAKTADSYVGRKYGYLKIVAHFLDWLIGGRYVFRRVAGMDRYPICSWVVSYAYKSVGMSFGVEASAASPDDIWDWVTDPQNGYVQIHPLEKL